jgi:hypothetical protein
MIHACGKCTTALAHMKRGERSVLFSRKPSRQIASARRMSARSARLAGPSASAIWRCAVCRALQLLAAPGSRFSRRLLPRSSPAARGHRCRIVRLGSDTDAAEPAAMSAVEVLWASTQRASANSAGHIGWLFILACLVCRLSHHIRRRAAPALTETRASGRPICGTADLNTC